MIRKPWILFQNLIFLMIVIDRISIIWKLRLILCITLNRTFGNLLIKVAHYFIQQIIIIHQHRGSLCSYLPIISDTQALLIIYSNIIIHCCNMILFEIVGIYTKFPFFTKTNRRNESSIVNFANISPNYDARYDHNLQQLWRYARNHVASLPVHHLQRQAYCMDLAPTTTKSNPAPRL